MFQLGEIFTNSSDQTQLFAFQDVGHRARVFLNSYLLVEVICEISRLDEGDESSVTWKLLEASETFKADC